MCDAHVLSEPTFYVENQDLFARPQILFPNRQNAQFSAIDNL